MTLTPQHFEALFRKAPGPVVVYDARFAMVAANDAFFRATGVTRAVIGRSVFEVFPGNPDDPEGAGPSILRASLQRVFDAGEPDRMPVTRYDIPRPESEGGGFLERYWSPSSYPVFGPDGRVAFAVHETQDVTEVVLLRRRESEQARELTEAQTIHAAIFDQGLFAGRLDLDGTLTDANRASVEQCGFRRDEVIGRPFWECGWWSRSAEVQAWVRAAVDRARRGEPFRGESAYFLADGTERVVDFACTPIRDRSGAVAFLSLTGMDVTDRIRADRERRATAILESMTDAFFSVDRQWRFTYLNGQAEAGLQRRRADLLGKNLWDEFPKARGTKFDREYHHAMSERKPVSFEEHYLEPLDRWYEVNGYPTEEGLAVYFRDVTERRGTRAALEGARRRFEEQARQFDATLSAVRDFVFAFDPDGRVLFANRALLDLWGLSADEAIGKTVAELGYPEETRGPVEASIRRVVETGLPTSDEVPYRNPSGRSGYHDYKMAPVFDATGAVVQVVGSSRDATERHEAEERLKEGERRFRTLFNSIDEGFCIIELIFGADGEPADYRFLEANAAFAGQTGLRDAAGRTMRELEPGHERHWFEIYGRVARTGEPVRFVNEARALGRWFDVYAFRLGGAEAARVGVLFKDITEARLAEQDLRASEERFRFLDALGEATRSASDAGEIMAATAGLLGEHLGATRTAYASVDPDGDRFVIHHDWTESGAASTVGVYSLDLFGPRAADDMRSGRTLVLHDVDAELAGRGGASMFNAIGIKAIVCCPLVKAGRLAAMMAVHQAAPRDWTSDEVALVQEVVERSWAHIERVRAAEALREADRRKDEFLAMLAHELRNPLSAIGNAIQVVRRADAPEHLDWAKGVIAKHVDSLSRMIDDLLDVSRITRGKIELKSRPVDLLAVVRGAVETARPQMDERGHDFTVAHSTAPMWVDGDPHRLEQVVLNLLNNAAKYTEAGGQISLTARRDAGGMVAVSVRDNGAGIEPGAIPRMFELFAQGDRSAARSEGGLGIGLTLVKSLVEMHGGSVAARSDGPGTGSEFTVRLPAIAPPAPDGSGPAAPPRAADGPPTHDPARGPRVLVVDDNEDSARGLARLLKILGYRVETAPDGPAALAQAAAARPDFVLLDIGLPGMDGYEVARRLRDDGFGDATIIGISGYGEESARSRSRAAGFDHHLVKPVDYDELVALLARGPRGA